MKDLSKVRIISCRAFLSKHKVEECEVYQVGERYFCVYCYGRYTYAWIWPYTYAFRFSSSWTRFDVVQWLYDEVERFEKEQNG